VPQLNQNEIDGLRQASYRAQDLLTELEQALAELDAQEAKSHPVLSESRCEVIQEQLNRLVYQLIRAGFEVQR